MAGDSNSFAIIAICTACPVVLDEPLASSDQPSPAAISQSRAIVLGASSLVGTFLVDRLVGKGVATIALSRQPHPPRPGLTWLIGDLRTFELAGQEQATLAFSVSPIWLLAPCIPALRRMGVVRLIAFSSTSRYTKGSSRIASEREVVQRLIQGELETQSCCERLGIAWTILRPTVIYAEGLDRSVTRLANIIRRFQVLPLAGDALGRRQPVHADDLAAGAIAAAESPAAANRAYEVPGGETLTYRAMAERIFEGMGRQPRVVAVPPVLWRLGLFLASPSMPGVTSEMGSRMAEDLVFDSSPAERDFNWRPRGFQPHFPPN